MYPATTRKVPCEIKINSPLPNYFDENLVEITLVSYGSSYQDCNQIRAKIYCSTCNEYKHELRQRCYRPLCPECYKSWISRECLSATDRIYKGFQMLRKEDYGVRMHHVVWSVPKSEYHYTYEKLWKRFHYRRRVAGSKAGITIFHPFRFRSKHGKVVSWKHCSFNRDAEKPVVQCILVYEPHFHTLSCGYLMRSKDFFERFGWVYKKLHHKKPIYDKENMRGVIWYSLSHTGIAQKGNDYDPNYHAVRWYGRFANNQMIIESTEVETLVMLCDKCNTQLVIEYVKDIVIDGHPTGFKTDWVLNVTHKHYKFKKVKCKNESEPS